MYITTSDCPFQKSEITLLQNVTSKATFIIEQDGNARTAPKALKLLGENIQQILAVVKNGNSTKKDQQRIDPLQQQQQPEDYTFTYEEEADPEIFFIPYVWEVIVCVITSSTIEWDKNQIRIFPLLDVEEYSDDDDDDDNNGTSEDDIDEMQSMIPQFARDVTDVV